MRIEKCTNGHYFDIDEHAVCPVCDGKAIIRQTAGFESKAELLDDDDKTIPIRNYIEDCKQEKELSLVGEKENEYIFRDKVADGGRLNDLVQNIHESEDGKTLSFFTAVIDAINVEEIKKPPVAGWIVCLYGKYQGESFTVRVGPNSIGRNPSNSIILNREKEISYNEHAFITYISEKDEFYIIPGEEGSNTFVNGKRVDSPLRIVGNEIIEMGRSKWMLIPLCKNDFKWSDYIK